MAKGTGRVVESDNTIIDLRQPPKDRGGMPLWEVPLAALLEVSPVIGYGANGLNQNHRKWSSCSPNQSGPLDGAWIDTALMIPILARI